MLDSAEGEKVPRLALLSTMWVFPGPVDGQSVCNRPDRVGRRNPGALLSTLCPDQCDASG